MGLIALLAGKQIFGRTISKGAAQVIVIVGLFFAALLAAALIWGAVKRDVIRDHQAKVERRAKPATDQAGRERANDAIDNSQQEKERRDAIAQQPDRPISPTSRALSCKRLRDAGRHPPACRRFEGRG